VVRFSAIHFQGRLIRQVSCYTLLSGFRLPWPPSCCLYQPTLFLVSDERTLGHFNITFGSSRIASSAYQKWPTSYTLFEMTASLKQESYLTHLEFESRRRNLIPPNLQSLALQDKTIHVQLLSWEKLRRKPATRWFD